MRTLFVFLLLASSAPAAGPALPIDAKQLHAELEAVYKKHDLPAMGVAIVRSSGVVLVDVVGFRKRGDDTKATAEDKFHIGSDTKAITATLVALLVQDKKLSYDMTLEKALPDLAKKMNEDFRGVTLEQLLSHRSGIRGDVPDKWKIPRTGPTPAMHTAAARTALAEEPQSGAGSSSRTRTWGTSSSGRSATAGKDSWESLVKKDIFAPLGMKSPASARRARAARSINRCRTTRRASRSNPAPTPTTRPCSARRGGSTARSATGASSSPTN